MGNISRVSKIVGVENINLKTVWRKCEEMSILQDVRFVAIMKIDFISIDKLNDGGYKCEFGSHL